MRLVALSAVAPALWGTTYLVTTEFLPANRPLLAAAARALPAGLLLVATVAVVAGRRVVPTGAWWWRAPILGTLNIGIFFALLFLAAYRLPGGVAAVLGAAGPFVAAGFAYLLYRDRPAPRSLIAAAIGVVGVALLVLRSSVALDPVGLAAAAGGVVTMSLATVLGRRWGAPEGFGRGSTAVLALTGWQLVTGGLLLVPAALMIEGAVPALTPANLAGYAYLSIVGTAVAYFFWFRGVHGLAPARVTLLALLSSVVAAALGWVVLGQSLSPGQLLGAAAVLGAVLFGAKAAKPTTAGRVVTAGNAPALAGALPGVNDGRRATLGMAGSPRTACYAGASATRK